MKYFLQVISILKKSNILMPAQKMKLKYRQECHLLLFRGRPFYLMDEDNWKPLQFAMFSIANSNQGIRNSDRLSLLKALER